MLRYLIMVQNDFISRHVSRHMNLKKLIQKKEEEEETLSKMTFFLWANNQSLIC